MTSKKYLSNKKVAQQTISISPALKDWVQRYVNVNRRNSPKEAKFKSVSSFISTVLEDTMNSYRHNSDKMN